MTKRKNYSANFKTKVALEAFTGKKSLVELSISYGVHQNLASKWKKQLQESATAFFADEIRSCRRQALILLMHKE